MKQRIEKLMVQLPQDKVIFVHIPKTGGRYLREMGMKSELFKTSVNHLPVRWFKEILHSKHSFSIIRNPYERFFSCCLHNNVFDKKKIERLSFMMQEPTPEWIVDINTNFPLGFAKQTYFLTDDDDKTILVEKLIDFDNILDVEKQLNEWGITLKESLTYRTPLSKNWGGVLTPVTCLNIEKIYQADFELLNY